MSRDDVLRLLQQRPFQPFRLRLSDGIVGTPTANAPFPAVGDYVIVSLLPVVQLEPLPVPASPTNN